VAELTTVDLNTAAQDELEGLPMICPARARSLIESRPIKSWQEIALMPGFDFAMVDGLQRGGATLGASFVVGSQTASVV
jgi:DNA uptake protein ComE-like DNA-binding protein